MKFFTPQWWSGRVARLNPICRRHYSSPGAVGRPLRETLAGACDSSAFSRSKPRAAAGTQIQDDRRRLPSRVHWIPNL